MSTAQPVADALEAAFAAQDLAAEEGKKPAVDASLPYVVWWLDAGRVFDSSLRARDGFTMRVVVQHYGRSPDAVRVAVRKSRAAVLSLNGAAAGDRLLLMPFQEPPGQMDRDDSADPPLWWQSEVWTLPTTLA